jgi:hypothetical protein
LRRRKYDCRRSVGKTEENYRVVLTPLVNILDRTENIT